MDELDDFLASVSSCNFEALLIKLELTCTTLGGHIALGASEDDIDELVKERNLLTSLLVERFYLRD